MATSQMRSGDDAAQALAVRIPQAARMIGIGRSTFYGYIKSGEIEVIKIGRSTVIPVEALHDFISRRRVNGR